MASLSQIISGIPSPGQVFVDVTQVVLSGGSDSGGNQNSHKGVGASVDGTSGPALFRGKVVTIESTVDPIALIAPSVTINGKHIMAPTFESSELVLSGANTVVYAAHGLGRAPYLFQGILRCKTAEHGYAVGDEINLSASNGVSDGRHVPSLFANNAVVSIVFGSPVWIARRDSTPVSQYGYITFSKWKVILRAW